MELTINIDEKKFTEILNSELEHFSEKELHNICREGLMKLLSDPENFRGLFVHQECNSYWNSNTDKKYYANDILKEAASSVELSPLFEHFQEDVVNYLKENHDKIIKDLMADVFMRGFSNFMYSSEFMTRLRSDYEIDQSNREQKRKEENNR